LLVLAISLLLYVHSAAQSLNTKTGSIQLTIQHSKAIANCTLLISLFASKDGFPEKYNKAFRTEIIKGTGKSSVCVFENLPAGNYAIAVLADVNNDGKMNTNMLGIPKEAYGFSNNVTGLFGPPSFEKAQVIVQEDKKTSIIVKLSN
jgi:uncharacterized protein (DUF2141 family)